MRRAMALGGVPVPAAASCVHTWRWHRDRGPVCTTCGVASSSLATERARVIAQTEAVVAFEAGRGLVPVVANVDRRCDCTPDGAHRFEWDDDGLVQCMLCGFRQPMAPAVAAVEQQPDMVHPPALETLCRGLVRAHDMRWRDGMLECWRCGHLDGIPAAAHVAATVTAEAWNAGMQANTAGLAVPLAPCQHSWDTQDPHDAQCTRCGQLRNGTTSGPFQSAQALADFMNAQRDTYGRVDIERWKRHKELVGEELQVLLDGVDVTYNCKAAHDQEGWAEVRRENMADTLVLGAFERRTGQVVIRPRLVPLPLQEMGSSSCAARGLLHDWKHAPDGGLTCRDCGVQSTDAVPQPSSGPDLHYCPNKGQRLRWEDIGELLSLPSGDIILQRCIHCGEQRAQRAIR